VRKAATPTEIALKDESCLTSTRSWLAGNLCTPLLVSLWLTAKVLQKTVAKFSA
jgi:hypothetical protein